MAKRILTIEEMMEKTKEIEDAGGIGKKIIKLPDRTTEIHKNMKKGKEIIRKLQNAHKE